MSEQPRDRTSHYEHSWLESPAAIAAEAAAWDRLVADAHDGNPFLTAGWFLLWLRHFTPAGGRVCFLKVKRRSRIVGYFPFLLTTELFHGLPIRALRLAGNVYSPIQSPVLAHGASPALFDHVIRRALPELPWTVLLADDLPLEYPGPAELHTALDAAGHGSHLLPGEGNWLMTHHGTGAAYLAGRDRSLRGHLRQASGRLAELGPVEVRVAAEDVREDDLAAYLSVYGRSWKEPELDPSFHPAMIRWAAESGCLRLFTLRAGGRPIAAQLWLVRAGRAYAVKFAFDEEHRPRSPGNLLMARAMERFLDVEAVGQVDFLKGDDRYKRDWCDRRRQRLSLLAFSLDAPGRAASLLDRQILPWIRRRQALSGLKHRAASWLAPPG